VILKWGINQKGLLDLVEKKRCVLIDGHSLAYRAFFALPLDLATSSGQVTNAVYGFTSMIIKVMEELKPCSIIVAFDKGKPAFRTDTYAAYKAHRKPMPNELREQMDIIHAVLEALGIPYMEEEGYEADDVLATLTEIIPEDADIYIVTGDRDALQLVNEHIKVIANRKGITDIVTYDIQKIKEQYGIEPHQIVDYLALKGDASDNIPGVPGIGEKTAAALIAQYGNLDNIYASLDEINNARWKKALVENQESAFLSRDLARMRQDVPLENISKFSWELQPWSDEVVQRTFSSLEFKKLYERLVKLKPILFPKFKREGGGNSKLEPASQIEVKDQVSLDDLYKSCKVSGALSLYAHINGDGFTRGKMRSMSIAARDNTYYFDLDDEKGRELLGSFLSKLIDDKGLRINCYRGKDIMVQCIKKYGISPLFDFDIELASYLINPSGVKHDLNSSMLQYLDIAVEEKSAGQMDLLEAEKERSSSEMRMALAVERLVPPLEAEMNMRDLYPLYEDIEMPLQAVLADMEVIGVRLDKDMLHSMGEELEGELNELEGGVFELAGESFNLNSPQQLSHILFDVLKLTPVKRTKTGLATDVGVLTTLKEQHPIAGLLLRYRELSKLLNTYIIALPRLVDKETGRLHTCFNQTVTATGRLSSSSPNLQNIPIRTSLGKKIRKAFLPTSGDGFILSADYSQIELRIMAHLSGDAVLKGAFEEDMDIHTATACEVFGIPFEQVTPEYRTRAKAINFGIIYGISPFGLAEQLDITHEEAELYIAKYFNRYPQVRLYLDRLVEEATANGYVATLLGRRRDIPELSERNLRLRRLGERLAFNTPIQGSAADIIKVAMLQIHRRLRENGLQSHMIMQVHDELVFDVEREEVDEVREMVIKEMEGAYKLDIPLKVEVGIGASWHETK
jgi:DNA polymerase I